MHFVILSAAVDLVVPLSTRTFYLDMAFEKMAEFNKMCTALFIDFHQDFDSAQQTSL